jgi:hypothetical protein
MMITQEETKACELMRWEVDGLGPDSQEFKSGQTVWHKGITLPAQPVFLDDIPDDDIIMLQGSTTPRRVRIRTQLMKTSIQVRCCDGSPGALPGQRSGS